MQTIDRRKERRWFFISKEQRKCTATQIHLEIFLDERQKVITEVSAIHQMPKKHPQMSACPTPEEGYGKDKQPKKTKQKTKKTQIAKKKLFNTQHPTLVLFGCTMGAAHTSQTDRGCGLHHHLLIAPHPGRTSGAASAFSSPPLLSGPSVMAFCSLAIPSGTFRVEFACLVTG